MTELVEHRTHPAAAPERVVALCDQALAMAGLPTCTALAQTARDWETAANAEAAALGRSVRDARQLRLSHSGLATDIDAAMRAIAIGNGQVALRILDEAKRLADLHSAHALREPIPPNVTLFDAHRVVRTTTTRRL
ncbi:hypothetical protein [Methylobacterium sp.]|uniref:hypothetical protein n=1 Tax=Methylobacterium sp. TaxID=409 RepID=UPI0025DFBF94|nr:hypothetical protein [Methylobacterium sp.]MBY0256176.1 hypothetical protein [Methylobacterium sp.]